MRNVKVYYNSAGGDKEFLGYGRFHQWGIAFEEFESGPAQYTTAIVEIGDSGHVLSVPAEMIIFDDVDEEVSHAPTVQEAIHSLVKAMSFAFWEEGDRVKTK